MKEKPSGTILVLDDDEGVARLQQIRLRRAGFSVEVAHSAVDAMAILRRQKIDLAVIDYQLGEGLTGLELYRKVKADGINVPAILVTGFSDESRVLEAMRAGIRDFVLKSPEYLDYLAPAVARVISSVLTERRLAESEARLGAILESVQDAILTVDPDQKITFCNPAAQTLFCCHDGCDDLPVTNFIPAWSQLAPAREGAKPAANPARIHTEGRRADGSAFPLELTNATALDGVGQTGEHPQAARDRAVTCRDLTPQQQAEKEREQLVAERSARAEAEARQSHLRKVLDSVPAFISVCSPAGDLVEINREPLTRLRLTREDMVGHPCCDPRWWSHDASRTALGDALERAALGEPSRFDAQMVDADGATHILDLTIVPLFDEQGKVTEVITSGVDVTDRVQAQEAARNLNQTLERRVEERTAELRDANAQMEAFSYTVSHDLRAPLRSMICFSDLMKSSYDDKLDEQGRDFLQRISNSATKMDRLIVALLAYSRTGRQALELAPVSLEALVQEVIAVQRNLFVETGTVTEVKSPLPSVKAHHATLYQAVENLARNAVKFTKPEEKPHLTFYAEDRDETVRLCVKDEGIGIAADHHERIFNVFERLHTDREYEGTGIGLAIVRKAVDRMGGKTGLISVPGEGATFWIELMKA